MCLARDSYASLGLTDSSQVDMGVRFKYFNFQRGIARSHLSGETTSHETELGFQRMDGFV